MLKAILVITITICLTLSLDSHLFARNFKPAEVLVKFKDNVSTSSKQALYQRHDLRLIRSYRHFPRLQHLRLPDNVDVMAYVQKLKQDSLIEYAEPNYIRKPMSTVIPNDTDWSRQWWASKIQAPEAWQIATSSDNIIVAVLDTGVNYLHPDLSANIYINKAEVMDNGVDDDGNSLVDDIRGWNFCSVSDSLVKGYYSRNDPMDKSGHGSHIAGIIAGVGNNSLGIAGINWKAKILPVRFLDGCGDVATEIKAIDYAIERGAKVINASYGDTEYSQSEFDAIKKAEANGILFVAAAGNSGANNDAEGIYPASYNLPNIISVASTDSDDNLQSSSNYGANSVHLAAPGSNIYSTKVGSVIVANNSVYFASKMLYASDTFGLNKKIIDCGFGSQASDFPAEVSGNIALIQRDGVVTFQEKISLAMQAGAVAAIIYNNVEGTFEGTLGSDRTPAWIPTVSVSKEDGEALKALAGQTVRLISVGDAFGYYSGTSMAAAMVTGASALYWSLKPNSTYQEVKSAILSTVDKVPALADKTISGGRLNLNKLLSLTDNRIFSTDTLTLSQGWNFKGITAIPDNSSVTNVLTGLLDNIKIIWSYENGTWSNFKPSASSTLENFKKGQGYWFYSNINQNTSISGWSPKVQLIQLNNTWNLISWAESDISASEFVNRILGDWEVIWNWHDGIWSVLVKDPALKQSLNYPEITTIYKGRAYWIKKKTQ